VVRVKIKLFAHALCEYNSVPFALMSCSKLEKTGQVFESALKKFFGFGFQSFCEWHHKWRIFKWGKWATLVHFIWPWAQTARCKYFAHVFIGNYCRL